ncbi:MAG: hypothetical protein ACI4JB_02185 [Porcipelethomonas sp.]
MNFMDIFVNEKTTNLNNETWYLDKGDYTGVITEFKTVKNGAKLLLKIQLESGTVFMNCPYNCQINRDIFDPFMRKFKDISEIPGTMVDFTVTNNKVSDTMTFTNITRISESHKEVENDNMTQPAIPSIEEIVESKDTANDYITF